MDPPTAGKTLCGEFVFVLQTSRERPKAFDGLRKNPAFVILVQEFHVVTDHGERSVVSGLSFANGPIRAPHQALGAINRI